MSTNKYCMKYPSAPTVATLSPSASQQPSVLPPSPSSLHPPHSTLLTPPSSHHPPHTTLLTPPSSLISLASPLPMALRAFSRWMLTRKRRGITRREWTFFAGWRGITSHSIHLPREIPKTTDPALHCIMSNLGVGPPQSP